MAGHSKFKNIMHRKGAQDKKRAKVFSRLGREISVAVKVGGEDVDSYIASFFQMPLADRKFLIIIYIKIYIYTLIYPSNF